MFLLFNSTNKFTAKTDFPVPGPPLTIITFLSLADTVSIAFLNAYS